MVKKKCLPAKVLIIVISLWAATPTVRAQISLDVGGYMQNWYIANQSYELLEPSQGHLPVVHTRTVDTHGFRIRRARLVARGRINDTFSAASWIEFAGNTPSLLCFYADANIKPWLNIRVGQLIMPGQPYDTARLASSGLIFYERPAITTRLSNVMGYSAFRDIGLMVYGQHGRLWYGIQAGNGAGRFNQAGSAITERKAGGGLFGARADFEVFEGFALGGHISTNQQRDVVQSGTGPFDINRTSYSFRAASNGLGIKGLFSQIEYMNLTGKDDSRGIVLNGNKLYKLHGYYAELGYKITRDWHILVRYDEMTEKPGQQGFETDFERSPTNNFTFGLSRFIYENNKEIVRTHLNYSFGENGPIHLDNSIVVLVFQIRFIS